MPPSLCLRLVVVGWLVGWLVNCRKVTRHRILDLFRFGETRRGQFSYQSSSFRWNNAFFSVT